MSVVSVPNCHKNLMKLFIKTCLWTENTTTGRESCRVTTMVALKNPKNLRQVTLSRSVLVILVVLRVAETRVHATCS
jgi:hypothetical protein